ncbi:hypothetical protein EDD85DRAFT_792474 [Armillaria nabsnona]|nr:hypothetical protein EDD85DRAFT_792474 [Armillaria nabsnona]
MNTIQPDQTWTGVYLDVSRAEKDSLASVAFWYSVPWSSGIHPLYVLDSVKRHWSFHPHENSTKDQVLGRRRGQVMEASTKWMQRIMISSPKIATTRPQLARFITSSQQALATGSVIPKLEEEPEATVLAPSSLAWALEEENRIRCIPGGYHPAQLRQHKRQNTANSSLFSACAAKIPATLDVPTSIPEHGAKRVIRDVLSVLDYVHNDYNIMHMDVGKITNVVMTAPHEEMPQEGLGALILAQLYTFPAYADNDTLVTLVNFGVAYYADKTDEHFTQEVFPVGICPQRWLYVPAGALGEFPASLRNRSRISKAWFNDDGSLRHKDLFPKKSLEALVEEQSGGALTLSPDCLHFMRRMLTLEPDECASTIEELLSHRWLK